MSAADANPATPEERSISEALADVRARMRAATPSSSLDTQQVRLVGVSKTKPAEAVMEAYAAGQRVFGENYTKEILEKAPLCPADVQWHFIGHMQSNKVKDVIEAVPNLVMVETVDSAKLADKLEKACATFRPTSPLSIMLQVNTSGEETKFGVEPSGCVPLATHIATQCKHLRLVGLMTIGQPDYSSRPENFTVLSACRREVALALGLAEQSLELSMGMSGDFEQAIQMGSTNIRVGSTIFGARVYAEKPAVV
ncbi:MAG: hypothetical protein WDW38_002170 [Sanguina aurantia]